MSKIVAFLDRNVEQPELLVKAMPAGTEIAYIEPGQPGLAQMARHLAGRSQVDSVHLISHGRPGAIQLAGQWLDMAAIEEQRDALAAIGAALGAHGDLLIYGCEVAKGAAGQALVRQIAHYTRSDIAASSTLTGAAELGGDWDLDVRLGQPQAASIVPAGVAYGHVLLVTIDLPAEDDSGEDDEDNITNVNPPSIQGTSPHAYAPVYFYANMQMVGSGSTDASGAFDITLDSLADGVYDLTAFVDSSGGGEVSSVMYLTIDTTDPTAVAYVDSIDEDNGEYDDDFATNDDNALMVYGHLEGTLGSGDEAQISRDGGSTWAALSIDGSGDWSYNDTIGGSSGDFTYITRVIDLAGNIAESGDSQEVDINTDAPNACIEVSDCIITDADAMAYDSSGDAFTVTVTFDTAMNMDVIPEITFSPNVDSTLTALYEESEIQSFVQILPGYWEDAYTFIVNYAITDACVDENCVTIDVTGAESFWGEAQADYTPEDEFEIDTHNPSVVSVVYGGPAIDEGSGGGADGVVNDADVGQVFTISITFDEKMDTSTDPEITFIPEEGPLQVLPFPESPPLPDDWLDTFVASGDGYWEDCYTYVLTYTIVDLGVHAGDVTIDVEGAKDANGNDQKNYCPDESFQLDTLHLIGTVYADTLTGNEQDDWIYGDNSVDTLNGAGGNDYLDGGQWGDSMTGGAGDDIYVADNTNDKAIESSGSGSGTDIVFASVNFTLGVNVENLTLTGAGNINGKGNGDANIILGNTGNNLLTGMAGADTLDGGAGNDSLTGGAGNDSLTGGANNDTFIFDTAIAGGTNVDHITDFNAPTDTIRLVKSIFTALTTGTLTAAQWENGDGVASLATHRILLDNSTGNLYYDSDGTGAAARVQFASLDVADLAGISNADFTVTLV